MSLLQNPCSVCGLAILSGDSFIGTGDGQMTNGGSFAHDVCYYRDQANHLQKLCEEQRAVIKDYEHDLKELGIADLRAKKAHLFDVYDSLGIKWGDDPFHAVAELKKRLAEYRGQELLMAQLEREVEEQKGEIEEIKSLHALQRTRYGVAEKWWRSRKPRERELQSPDLGQLLDELMGALVLAQNDALESRTLESQLATQTERVKELEGVLTDLKRHNNHTIEEEMWRIDQALNQESLGDGGKGK